MQQLFSQHLAQIQRAVARALDCAELSGLWIYAGAARTHFLDDCTAPFKINPHFNWVFPCPQAEKSWLFLDGKNKPQLYFFAPEDYWHSTPQPPIDAFFASEFNWHIVKNESDITGGIFTKILPAQQPCRTAFLGEDETLARSLGFDVVNPQKVLNVLHFARSIKTGFEIAALKAAQTPALKGHYAAREAFLAGASEFEINLAYLQASQQSDLNVPYGNIVAQNEHAAILHYTQLDLTPPATLRSFLLDAGASFLGYAADLTRTYARDPQSEFAELVAKLDALKLASIAQLKAGKRYLDLHQQMHRWIAQLLYDFDFVRLSPEQIFDEGISRIFFPHGLGHLLGLQVHDVAGFLQNEQGDSLAPPAIYPSLRCTRELTAGMVLTIEPGCYFIEMLLAPHRQNRHFNWAKIDAFRPFGGVRSEDNVLITETGAENLTAQAETAFTGTPQ